MEHIPADLALVRDFVNSRDPESGTDDLAEPAALRSWLEGRALFRGSRDPRPEEVANARRVGEAIRSLAAVNAGHPVDAGALEILNEAGRQAPLALGFDATGSSELRADDDGVRGAMARLLAIVHDAMSRGTWVRMKPCERHSCRWLFYDQAKNRSGKWCSMAVCGNRTKAEAYRRRQSGDAPA